MIGGDVRNPDGMIAVVAGTNAHRAAMAAGAMIRDVHPHRIAEIEDQTRARRDPLIRAQTTPRAMQILGPPQMPHQHKRTQRHGPCGGHCQNENNPNAANWGLLIEFQDRASKVDHYGYIIWFGIWAANISCVAGSVDGGARTWPLLGGQTRRHSC